MSRIKEELEALRQDGEVLQTQTCVDWARAHPTSALHNSLEWDDAEAAENWRNWQVRRLIGIHITDAEGSRQLVSLSIDRTKSGGGYRAIDDVLKTSSLREILLQDALKELERVRIKYESVKELERVWLEAAAVQTKVRTRKARAKIAA